MQQPQQSPPVTVIFTAEEVAAIVQMLDAATKSLGLKCAGAATIIYSKLMAAVEQTQQPSKEPDKVVELKKAPQED